MTPRGLSTTLQQAIIRLRDEGFSYTGVARQLRLTKGQVAGVLFRAGKTRKKKSATADERQAEIA
jgi:DNA-directed RNA polymerase specialized sigma24 family protein